jgi:deoxycytidine triphosphate deaminase
LTDQQLKGRLEDFHFQAEITDAPFDAERQIGPASVDLRLGCEFWKAKTNGRFRRGRVLDLERTRLMEMNPHRGWQRTHIGPGRKVTIKPGEMILGRTCEKFEMPKDCIGLLEGRSSYARLGLAVHATGGFINPGWRGHMPLTLINHNAVTLRSPIGTPLCQ